ncbi:MAG: hypothetical protein AAFU70_04005, partial [Planctomycetota bacterium]
MGDIFSRLVPRAIPGAGADEAGAPVDAAAPWLNDGAQNLCRWIFGARPDAQFFVHGHEEEVMAVGSIEE